MAPKKGTADGEKAKPVATVSSRVTRSMDRRTRSATQGNVAKPAVSVTKKVKLTSPKKGKRKKSAIETGKAKKAKKEEETDVGAENEEETDVGAEEEEETDVGAEKEEETAVEVEKEEAEDEDPTKPKIVIEHCKQCSSFKTRAIKVKEGLEGAIPGITVTLNPGKPRRGCFEIREEGGETFITLLEMKRPFAPMKALDMEEVIEDIIKKIK